MRWRTRSRLTLAVLLATASASASPLGSGWFPPSRVNEWVPTPLLVGRDDAPMRIVVYDSLACPYCDVLEQQVIMYRKFLERNRVAFEFRLIPVDDSTLRKTIYVMYRVIHQGADAITEMQRARKMTISEKDADQMLTPEVRAWIQWYVRKAMADKALVRDESGNLVAQTPLSYALYMYQPLMRFPAGLNEIELLLAPFYDLGLIEEEFSGVR